MKDTLKKTMETLDDQETGTLILSGIWIYQLRRDGCWWEIEVWECFDTRDLALHLLSEERSGNPWRMY